MGGMIIYPRDSVSTAFMGMAEIRRGHWCNSKYNMYTDSVTLVDVRGWRGGEEVVLISGSWDTTHGSTFDCHIYTYTSNLILTVIAWDS